jgi:hypothetical protein
MIAASVCDENERLRLQNENAAGATFLGLARVVGDVVSSRRWRSSDDPAASTDLQLEVKGFDETFSELVRTRDATITLGRFERY